MKGLLSSKIMGHTIAIPSGNSCNGWVRDDGVE